MAPGGKSLDASINYIVEVHCEAVKKIAYMSQALNDVPATSTQTQKKFDQVDALLTWLEDEVEMTRVLKARSKVDLTLQMMFKYEEYHFPIAQRYRAESLYQRFEAVGWNESKGNSEDADSGVDLPGPSARGVKRSILHVDGGDTEKRIMLPPADHPIWGRDGIMFGVALGTSYKTDGSKRRSLLYDERYNSTRRSARVLGHNGIEVGQWYPRQLVACFHGAHGQHQTGIFGVPTIGAYSIVVSGHYDDLDKDNGDFLYYSAPNSHNNEDPNRAPDAGPGSQSLHKSMLTERPVRVLRTSTGKSKWAPRCGLRYDGLYLVVAVNHPINGKGGMYEQFHLKRQAEQPAIDLTRPSAREAREEAMINNEWERIRG